MRRRIVYTYDALGRPLEIRDRHLQPPWPSVVGEQFGETEEILATYTYVGPSQMHNRTLGGVIFQTNEHDEGTRLSELAYWNSTEASAVVRVGFSYTYDDASRLTAKDKLHGLLGDEDYTIVVYEPPEPRPLLFLSTECAPFS